MTSNPVSLPEALRAWAEFPEFKSYASHRYEGGRLVDDLADAAAEIDRLTAELASLKDAFNDRVRIIEIQLKDKDRLRAALTEVRAERNYLRGSLETIASGSLDDMPPFRAAPHDVLRKFAQKALDWPRATDTSSALHKVGSVSGALRNTDETSAGRACDICQTVPPNGVLYPVHACWGCTEHGLPENGTAEHP